MAPRGALGLGHTATAGLLASLGATAGQKRVERKAMDVANKQIEKRLWALLIPSEDGRTSVAEWAVVNATR